MHVYLCTACVFGAHGEQKEYIPRTEVECYHYVFVIEPGFSGSESSVPILFFLIGKQKIFIQFTVLEP